MCDGSGRAPVLHSGALDSTRDQLLPNGRACRTNLVPIIRRLELFGSAIGPKFDPRSSDLDFIVEFGSFAAGEYAEHYFALLDELKELFGRPVDLLVSRAVRNPYLLESINRSRELLYAA